MLESLEDFFLKNNTLSSSYEHTVSFVYIKGPVCEKKLKIEEKQMIVLKLHTCEYF